MAKRTVSIATKLTRMNMLVSAAALLLACAGFVAYDLATFRQNLVNTLSTQSQIAGSNSVSAILFNDSQSAVKTLSAFEFAPNVVAAAIYTANGQLFAAYRRDARADIPPSPRIAPDRPQSYSFDHQNVTLVHTIVFQGHLAGYVFLQSDLRLLTTDLERYLAISGLVLLLSLAVALFVSRLARRSIAEPVVNLATVARRVSRDQDYSVRAMPGGEDTELADLVATFNEMLGQIALRDTNLAAARDDLEHRVEQRTAELAAANKELESFSYSVSHDLRAPLRSIDGFSQALAEDYADKLDAQAKSYIDRVRAATQRMGMLIDDMLNLSRVTRTEMRRERVDLTALAQSIVAELQKSGAKRDVDWIIEDKVSALGDAHLLRVVLENLLGNAWKYTSRHPRARIEFGKQRRNGSFAYFVKDDGAGFDPAYSQRLFGAFQRLHGMTEFPGTGIGLATVQRIIHRHGGEAWAEGAVEHGATFYFSL